MADLTTGVALAQRLDAQYAQKLEERVQARKAEQAAQAEADDNARATDQATQTRANQAADLVRSLNADQILREQQQAVQLRRLDEDRQAAIDAARRAEQPPARGAIVDVLA